MGLSSNTKKLLIRILLFLVYLLLGAAIFYGIELSNERAERDKNNFQSQYDNFTKRYNISNEDMKKFIGELQKALKLGYNATKESWPDYYRWDFMNAFHFAGNVVTTIGYGHISPVTLWGQIVCIVYALLGIPLTGLTLRSIGNRISEYIATTIKGLDRKFYNRETEKLEIKTAIVAFGCLLVIIFIPAIGFSKIEKWQYSEAVYFCFITLTTIGFGDFVPGSDRDRYDDGVEVVLEFLNLFYMVLGLAVMSGVIVSISGVIEEKTKNLGVADPLEALRNIRVENLNSRALKKLGYKMGPGGPQATSMNHADMDHSMPNRLPPKLAPKTLGTNSTMERSRSAETMDFQGPTPVMYLNKKTGNDPGSSANANTGSPPTSKLFNNKIAPVTLPENNVDSTEKTTSSPKGTRKPSDNNSTSTESAEEARASDEDNEVATMNESVEIRQDAELDGLETCCEDPKNNLVVQVQVTPMPSPRESPVPARSSIDSIPLTKIKSGVDQDDAQMKSVDADSEHIETYEGSFDSASYPFQMDRTDSSNDSNKISEPFESVDNKNSSIPESNELRNAQHAGHHKPRTKDTTNTTKVKNGFIAKTNQTRPMLKKGNNGRSFKPVHHIDLGDKSVTKR